MLLMLMSLTGCFLAPKTCNLMYAPDFVEVTLSDALFEADKETVYTFEGDDGTVITCPLLAGEDYTQCDDLSSGFAVDGDDLVGSLGDYAPETLALTVSVDGSEEGSWAATPTYTEDEPNGEGCGFRYSGDVTFDLSE